MSVQVIIESLRQSLPPVFPRKTVSRMMGDYLAVGTLANLDSEGRGPGGVRAGKAILYERESFLAWLQERLARSNGDVA